MREIAELEKQPYIEPDTWTIITALDRVLSEAENSQLSKTYWETVKTPLAFLRRKLKLTNMQIIALAMLIDSGEPMTWKEMGIYLGISRLSMMVYSEEIEELVAKRWMVRRTSRDHGICRESLALASGVVTSIRHNQVYVPEKIDGLTEQQFVSRVESQLGKYLLHPMVDFRFDEEWLDSIISANADLPLCKAALSLDDIHERSLLMLLVVDYAMWEGSENEGMSIGIIDAIYPDDIECDFMRDALRSGDHILMERGYVEFKCDDGQADNTRFMLTREAKQKLLGNYAPSHSQCRNISMMNEQFVRKYTTIKEKKLFFNADDQRQVDRLADLLSADSLPAIQQRLEEQGMRKGFACLFYGAPGTGKTETVLQIARQTGRHIMQVDIAGLRDKWVGESEKNIKEVFSRYRSVCRSYKVMPILFFNEADAIINCRNENVQTSVDKMNNAMQNIILQELENLDGILIATTNLTSNLDKAFDRRFLYKVEFHKPNTEVKMQIWQSMLDDLSTDDARQLATSFDFSGGQIENIARKRTVDYILSGKNATVEELRDYCRAEQLNGRRRNIGFTN
jgi:hypothetical protein